MNFTLYIEDKLDWKNKDKTKVKGAAEWKSHKLDVLQLIKKRFKLSNVKLNTISIKSWERNLKTNSALVRGEAPDDVASQLDQQII